MAINEAFAREIAAIAHDREALIAKLAELDGNKRAIRSQMRAWSNEPADNGGLQGPERYRTLRSKKAKLQYLEEERDYVRQHIAALNEDRKALNRARHRKPEFAQAFVAAAERVLDEETFLALERKAAELMEQSG